MPLVPKKEKQVGIHKTEMALVVVEEIFPGNASSSKKGYNTISREDISLNGVDQEKVPPKTHDACHRHNELCTTDVFPKEINMPSAPKSGQESITENQMPASKIKVTPVNKQEDSFQVGTIQETTLKNEIPSKQEESVIETKNPFMEFQNTKKEVICIAPQTDIDISKENIMEAPEIPLRKIILYRREETKEKREMLFLTPEIAPLKGILHF